MEWNQFTSIGTMVALVCGSIIGCGGEEAASNADLSRPLPEVVSTNGGLIRGTVSEDVRVFKGVPFAAPPIGDRRFMPPADAEPWTEALAAEAFGPGCMQGASQLSEEVSEDCLTLNIWAPDRQAPKPVMVWLHGGGFVVGTAGFQTYDGTQLAKAGDVVVVSANYRLGMLGFLPIQDEAHQEKRVLGLLDQQAALRWVRDNIASFGGDPNNVTIFGESAGGYSVCYHLGSPSSDGLYHRAIIQSGAGCAPPPQASLSADLMGDLLHSANCPNGDSASTLACLRALSAEALIEAQETWVSFGFSGDAFLAPLASSEPEIGSGRARRRDDTTPAVPVLIGSNADEMTFFTSFTGFMGSTQADFDRVLGSLGLSPAQEVEARMEYNERNYGSILRATESLMTDAFFTCPALKFARETSTSSHPAYVYRFDLNLGQALAHLRAAHAAEIPYVFGLTENGLLGLPIEVDPSQVAQIQSLWTHFAHHGEPPASLAWPFFRESEEQVMFIEREWKIGAPDYARPCDWLSVDGL